MSDADLRLAFHRNAPQILAFDFWSIQTCLANHALCFNKLAASLSADSLLPPSIRAISS